MSIEYSENESKSLKEIVSKREEILKGILYVSATESIAKVSRYRYECIPSRHKKIRINHAINHIRHHIKVKDGVKVYQTFLPWEKVA